MASNTPNGLAITLTPVTVDHFQLFGGIDHFYVEEYTPNSKKIHTLTICGYRPNPPAPITVI